MNSETWMLVVVLSLGPRGALHGELAGVYRSDRECIREGEAWLQHAYDWTARHRVDFGPVYACFRKKLDQVARRN
jgi:hypothetical protein